MSSIDIDNLIDSPDVLRLYSEGKTSRISEYKPRSLPRPFFRRMVIIDVVSDPHYMSHISIDPRLLGKKQEYWSNVLGVSNIKYANVLPRNTVIAVFANSDLPPMFVFPFFPSHLAMPCKPGELVWAFIEDPTSPTVDIAYWFCRVNEPHFVDDVNHTHSPRSLDPSFTEINNASLRERISTDGNVTTSVYELRNGAVRISNGERVTSVNNKLIGLKNAPDDIFDRLLTVTDGARLTSYESVPRFKKRPGDLVLEGSNNTLIVLGTDRYSDLSTYYDSIEGPVPFWPETDWVENAGTIDLIAGRGQSIITSGLSVATEAITKGSIENNQLGEVIKIELEKTPEKTAINEGDIDNITDRSRIQISQRTSPDAFFNLAEFNRANFNIRDDLDNGDSAVVVKSDKIRLIARSDIELLVTGFDTVVSPSSHTIKNEIQDSRSYSTIVIRSNGDIIIKPSELGMIKLGGDNADRALLCTDLPAAISESDVKKNVSYFTTPLTNTMGGKIGGTGIVGQGTWASKVLVVGTDNPGAVVAGVAQPTSGGTPVSIANNSGGT